MWLYVGKGWNRGEKCGKYIKKLKKIVKSGYMSFYNEKSGKSGYMWLKVVLCGGKVRKSDGKW